MPNNQDDIFVATDLVRVRKRVSEPPKEQDSN
jgi:hypothetical protein